jgi:hypothetical protein
MTKSMTFALLFTVLSCTGRAQTSDSPEAPASPQERRQNYLQLNRQIYARHQDPSSGQLNASEEKARSKRDQLHNMIAKEIDMALAAPNPSDGSIAGAISSLQGDLSMAGWVPDMDIPYAKFFTLSSVQSLAVAYVTLQGGDAIPDTQAYLEFYDKPTGIWEKKASAPTISDFKRSSFAVAQIDSGVPGEAWFLAWGLMIGSSDGSRNVRLYAFDGSKVRTIWKRDWLPGATITTAADSITLEYQDRQSPGGRAHEVLHVTSNGLQ